MAFLADTVQGATFAITGLATFLDTTTNIPRTSTPMPMIDATHLGTTGQRIRVKGDLTDPQQFTITHQHDGLSVIPVIGTTYTVTITAPLKAGDSVAEKWAGTAVCTDVRGSEFQSDTPALQTAETDWQPDGGYNGGSAWTRTIAS